MPENGFRDPEDGANWIRITLNIPIYSLLEPWMSSYEVGGFFKCQCIISAANF